MVLVVFHRGVELNTSGLIEKVVPRERTEALVEQILETLPQDGALVAFQHVVPVLSSANEM